MAALPGRSPRHELVALLLLGAAGAGLVLLSMRQGWAVVTTAAPKPLPASVVTDSGSSLVPYADALAIAALACLAAVIATKRVLRRITGILLAAAGASLAVAVSAGASASAAIAAAAGPVGPATGAGAGTAAGSATGAGSKSGPVAPAVSGFGAHVAFHAGGWQALAVAGSLAIVAAGVLVTWRSGRLPEMSGRYDPPAASARGGAAPVGPAGAASAGGEVGPVAAADVGEPAGPKPADSGARPAARAALDAAAIWESLSRGEDPTSALAGGPLPAPAAPAGEPD